MSDIISALNASALKQDIDVGSIFEDVVQRVYEAWLKPGDYAVDVGANQGRHLFPMAEAVGSTGRIYAFEPIKPLYRKLQKRIKNNNVNTIKMFEAAASKTKGKSTFSYFENRPAFSGLQRRETPFDDTEGGLIEIEVDCVTLDSKLPWPWLKKISALKLDIEGGELHALMGAERCLMKSRPMVVFENGRQASAQVYGYSKDDFYGFFERTGMQVFWLDGAPLTRDGWMHDINCWEFVALPKEKADWAARLPNLCNSVLDSQA